MISRKHPPLTIPGPNGTRVSAEEHTAAWTQLEDGHWTCMEWLILGLHPTEVSDRRIFVRHLNGDAMDCRRENLEINES